jgi:hypothetical protein
MSLRELLRHDGVEPRRHERTRHDAHALAGQDFAAHGLARKACADHVERGRRVDEQVAAAQGKAVHRRVVVRGHVDGRDDVAGQHAAQCAADGHALGRIEHRHESRDEVLSLRDGQCLGVVARDAGGDLGERGHGQSMKTIKSLSW